MRPLLKKTLTWRENVAPLNRQSPWLRCEGKILDISQDGKAFWVEQASDGAHRWVDPRFDIHMMLSLKEAPQHTYVGLENRQGHWEINVIDYRDPSPSSAYCKVIDFAHQGHLYKQEYEEAQRRTVEAQLRVWFPQGYTLVDDATYQEKWKSDFEIETKESEKMHDK
jgi:hypothetical protein